MFWRRATGHGAFYGLVSGTLSAALLHGLTVAESKGGWIAPLYTFHSGTGQAFMIASVAFIVCLVLTVVISLFTTPKHPRDLIGLVYSLTPKQRDAAKVWYKNPLWLGIAVLVVTVLLNLVFY